MWWKRSITSLSLEIDNVGEITFLIRSQRSLDAKNRLPESSAYWTGNIFQNKFIYLIGRMINSVKWRINLSGHEVRLLFKENLLDYVQIACDQNRQMTFVESWNGRFNLKFKRVDKFVECQTRKFCRIFVSIRWALRNSSFNE